MSNKLAFFLPPPWGIKLKYHKKGGTLVVSKFSFETLVKILFTIAKTQNKTVRLNRKLIIKKILLKFC